eukprot:COSAG01_NODE_1179_length_11363_cov_18.944701_1_plen_112_part_00
MGVGLPAARTSQQSSSGHGVMLPALPVSATPVSDSQSPPPPPSAAAAELPPSVSNVMGSVTMASISAAAVRDMRACTDISRGTSARAQTRRAKLVHCAAGVAAERQALPAR